MENLILSIWIKANDLASGTIARLGLSTGTVFGTMGVAAAGVLGAIGAVGVVSTVMASKFDQAMHKVYALTNTNADQMAWYKQQILALSPAIDVSATDLANGLYFVRSAGFQGQQAMDVLKYSAMAAAAGMTDMAGVADAVTSVMNAYKSSALDAGTATDVLERLVANGKVEWRSIATSIGFAAVTASAAQVKVQELGASISTLTQVAGEHGARRITMEFDNLMRSVGIDQEAVAKRAKKLGLAFDENKFALMSWIDKLRYLAQISGGVGYMDQMQAKAYMASGSLTNLSAATAKANSNFKSLIGGAAAFIPAYVLLSDKGKMYDSILQQMNGHGQYTQRSFDRMRESTGQLWKMFMLAGQSILITIGEQILPTVNTLLKAFIPMLRSVTSLLGTKEGMIQFKIALAAIAAVAGGVLLVALGMLVTTASPLLLLPAIFLATVAAVIAVGVVVNKAVAAFGGWDKMLRQLHPVIALVQRTFAQIGTELRAAFANPQLHAALAQLGQAFIGLKPLLALIGFVVGVVLFVAFHEFVALIMGLLGALPGLIMMFSGVLNVLGGLGRLVADIFTGKWKDILPALKQIGQGLLQIVVGALLAIVGEVAGFGGHILGIFGLSWAKVGQGIRVAWNAIVVFFGGIFGAIGTAVGNFFSWVGTQIHAWWLRQLATLGAVKAFFGGLFGGIGAAVGAVFNSLGTTIHSRLLMIQGIFRGVFSFIANLGPWLYHHNYYVQRFVDNIRVILAAARVLIPAIIAAIRAKVAEIWRTVQQDAHVAWEWVYQHIVQPVERLRLLVTMRLLALRIRILGLWRTVQQDAQAAWEWVYQHVIAPVQKLAQTLGALFTLARALILAKWHEIQRDVTDAWTRVLTLIGGFKDRVLKTVQTAVIQPIVDKWNWLKNLLANAGENLMKMIADSIRNGAHWIADAAKNSLGGIAKFLGFHSPAPAVPESAHWGANLIKMFAASMLTQQQAATRAAQRVLGSVQQSLSGGANAALSLTGGAGGLARSSATIAGGAGGGGTGTANYYITFPGVKNKQEIKDALAELQRDDYRKGRRAGGYQGNRAGI